jgi:hypothetical protein
MSGSERAAPLEKRFSQEDTPDRIHALQDKPIDQPPEGWRGWFFGFAQRMFLLVGFYVLSFGPMYWHWYGGRFAGRSQLVAAFYEPIFVLATLVPWFGEWMDWYVGLWIA